MEMLGCSGVKGSRTTVVKGSRTTVVNLKSQRSLCDVLFTLRRHPGSFRQSPSPINGSLKKVFDKEHVLRL